MERILLLDIENLPQSETELLTLFETYAFIYLVYAKSPISLSLDGLSALAPFIAQKRLVLLKMPKLGPDAADFGLAFLAGQLSVQKSVQTALFDVMSNDKKFEYIVDLLKASGFQAEQKKKQITPPVVPKTSQTSFDLNQTEYRSLTKALNILLRNQPKQLQALENGLKSWLNMSVKDVHQVLQQLKQHEFVLAEQQTLHYDLLKIRKALKTVKPEQKALSHTTDILPTSEQLQQKPHLQNIQRYCDVLNKNLASRPAKLMGLQNSIRTVFKMEQSQAILDFIQLLKKHQLIQLENSKVRYLDKNIAQWVSLGQQLKLLQSNLQNCVKPQIQLVS